MATEDHGLLVESLMDDIRRLRMESNESRKLCFDALALCERLSDQQATPDDSWRIEAKRIRDALTAERHKTSTDAR